MASGGGIDDDIFADIIGLTLESSHFYLSFDARSIEISKTNKYRLNAVLPAMYCLKRFQAMRHIIFASISIVAIQLPYAYVNSDFGMKTRGSGSENSSMDSK